MRALYEWIVDNDCTPYVLVDATIAGVAVPEQYVKDGQIVLKKVVIEITPSYHWALQACTNPWILNSPTTENIIIAANTA